MLLGTPLPELLARMRAEHGPVFLLQTGPVKQVWVGDTDALHRIYERPECSGRPVSFEDPFGDFLFLTREPEQAAVIKARQKAWLEANLQPEAIRAAAEDAMAGLWPILDSPEGWTWPEAAVRTALYGAVTRSFLGEKGMMSAEELEDFMAATTEYSEMRAKAKSGGGGEKELPPGSARIRSVLSGALARAGRGEKEAMPLMVAASIGGAEIFPTLLQWVVLALAQDGPLQERAWEAANRGDYESVMRVVYMILRRTSYSVALGPPRKILADVAVDGMLLPEGALLFAMHPSIVDKALGRTADDAALDDFSKYAFGVGPRSCLGQKLTEALLPAALSALLRRYRIAGLGPGEVKGELKGQLIKPVNAPAVLWERRA